MKHLLLCAFIFATGSLLSAPAHAIFEVRATYGLLASKPDLAPLFTGSPSLPTIAPTYGLGADAIISPPLFSMGFGVRYENMGVEASSSGIEFKANYSRTALLLNYRLIDTLLFLGPIVTYGISHSGEVKAIQNGTETGVFSSDKITSYSVGLEAGVKLIGFHLGAELGYQDFRWKNATDSTGNVATQDINMSGSYAKVLLGFGI
ncbi:hypothetical protein [Bdellovibrio sp. HCB337]|uniref:hypothetical protein n=1 Tax=Bdellovibrio sp. HCB337 TaxID=3394358 RepID=UPI0039A74F40